MRKLKLFMVAGAATMLSSCDLSQIPGLDGKLSIEDSKAIGAACRHSGRALEDCFAMNPKSHPAGVFDGWRDMNDYMIANQIDVVKPEIQSSAYRPEHAEKTPVVNGSAAESSASASTPASDGDSSPGVPRQRWQPKTAVPDSPTAAKKPDSVAGENGSAKEGGAVEPKSDPKPDKARPWERKKDAHSRT
ncbi:hypothetical protein NQT62_10590 [Limnobacter humi]|uniref:Lipoprotein n=1 Tax=Limnobacter humi TaxID=1778671 RepID=A0ABT1WH80_9BURK|nr:hypothetical protein [Limnobacter humi]MCQ8896877.1 hypothetical protein [Limnobacter humi]